MPRPRKYADTVVKSFSIEREVYTRLRAVLASQGKSISEGLTRFLRSVWQSLRALKLLPKPMKTMRL